MNQFTNIFDLMQAFPNEEACINHLEKQRWNGNVVSPFDPESKVYRCKGQRYRCKNTGKYFNAKTGTLFDNTKICLQKWFIAIYLVTSHKKGISSLQLSRDIGVTQKTAWFMLQRIRDCFALDTPKELSNEVEIDETYIGGKNINRHEHKKHFNPQGRNTESKAPVLGMLERGGKLIAKKVKDVKAETLTPEIIRIVKEASSVYTDEWLGYNRLKKVYDHLAVKHRQGEFVRGRVHTNSIEGFWSLFKRGIVGIYHFTSRKHLQRYVDEFVFRYNSRKMSEETRFNLMLSNCNNRLTYESLTANNIEEMPF